MTQKSKILVVEDNDFVRMQIVKFLQDAEYEVVEATDGKAALEQVSAEIDLAIVDVRMEPMGGFDFIRAVHGLDLETPSILVTGDQNPELLHEASTLGVAAVLMKPVERERLVKMVSRALQAGARS